MKTISAMFACLIAVGCASEPESAQTESKIEVKPCEPVKDSKLVTPCLQGELCSVDGKGGQVLVCGRFTGQVIKSDDQVCEIAEATTKELPCDGPWIPKVADPAKWSKQWGPMSDFHCPGKIGHEIYKEAAPPPLTHPSQSQIDGAAAGTIFGTQYCVEAFSGSCNDDDSAWRYYHQVQNKCVITDDAGIKNCVCMDALTNQAPTTKSFKEEVCDDDSSLTKDKCNDAATNPYGACGHTKVSPYYALNNNPYVYCLAIQKQGDVWVDACNGHANSVDCENGGSFPLTFMQDESNGDGITWSVWCGELTMKFHAITAITFSNIESTVVQDVKNVTPVLRFYHQSYGMPWTIKSAALPECQKDKSGAVSPSWEAHSTCINSSTQQVYVRWVMAQ